VKPKQLRFWPDPKPVVDRLGKRFFRHVPKAPGVYLMHGSGETVLYVGKARNLRQRLASYRVANPERLPRRLLRLLDRVERITWEICDDESAALRRESELLLSFGERTFRPAIATSARAR
jgi:excinuclease UvrABC nuclease subunit